MFLGITIIALGIVLLLQNLGILSQSVWEIFWPAVIIVLGLFMLVKSLKR